MDGWLYMYIKTNIVSFSSYTRLSKMSSVKSRDMDTISSLEEQLRGETVAKQRIETQLREQRSQASSQNQWSKEEMREVKEKLNRKEKELTSMKENLQRMQQKYQVIIICTYVRMSVCMYVCMYVCTYVCVYVYIYVCMHVYVCMNDYTLYILGDSK